MQPVQPAGLADAVLIQKLAANMCTAHGPSKALLEVARACASKLPAVMYVGLAVVAKDKQSLRYITLLSIDRPAVRLGSIAPASAAAGIAIHTKQVVNVRDTDTGDLGMEDLQYLRHVHNARSFVAVPLAVSQSALGALALASAEPHTFSGQESWLLIVAAMSAPHLTLMTSNLAALEGLVKQILPVRVALQLRDAAAVQVMQQQQQQSATLPSEAATPSSSVASSSNPNSRIGSHSSSTAAATAADSSLSGTAAAAAAGIGDDLDYLHLQAAAQTSRWQRQRSVRRPTATTPLMQQRGQHQQQQESGSALHSGRLSESSRWQRQFEVQQQPQAQQPRSLHSKGLVLRQEQQKHHQPAARQQQPRAIGWFLTFEQPELERAYRISTSKQWQQWLDGLFLLLTVLSAVGTRLTHGLTGDLLIDTLLLLLVASVSWSVFQRLHAMPAARYVQLRVPCIAALRILRIALFCWDARLLPQQVFMRPAHASVPSAAATAVRRGQTTTAAAAGGRLLKLLGWSQVEFAGCSMLLMLGLSGQLPMLWHVAVQFVSVVIWLAGMHVLAMNHNVWYHEAMHVLVSEIVLSWLVPVVVVGMVEWRTRIAFLKKLQ